MWITLPKHVICGYCITTGRHLGGWTPVQTILVCLISWWHPQMETYSALLAICAGNSPATSEFPSQRPVTWSFDVFFDLRLNKRLSKQSWGWSLETPLRSLWRHCNDGPEWSAVAWKSYMNIMRWKLHGWYFAYNILTHWGRVMHKCVSKLTIIGSDNGLSPGRRQAIIWTNARILLIGPLGTNLSEILIEIYTFSLKKIHLKVSSGKWRPSCLGLNVLNAFSIPVKVSLDISGSSIDSQWGSLKYPG